MKSRKPTSTFSSAGRAMTQIGTAPVGVGKGVVSSVGMGVGVVGKGVKNIFKKEGSKVVIEEQVVTDTPSASVSQLVPAQLGQNGAASDSVGASTQRPASPPIPNTNSPATLLGTLRVEVIDGQGLMAGDGDQVKPYVIASIGETEQKTKHVSKTHAPTW